MSILVKKKYKKTLLGILVSAFVVQALAVEQVDYTKATVEELRIPQAQQAMPDVFKRLKPQVNNFTILLAKAGTLTELTEIVLRQGKRLWQAGVNSVKNSHDADDRSLYWARLQVENNLRQLRLFKSLLPSQQKKLLWQLSLATRGESDVKFDQKANKKILVLGFDPFFLDRHIDQSNPSGAAVQALDNTVVNLDGKSAEIESLIIPVRFADFDQGLIEELLTPYLKNRAVDMIATISMGRKDFDLEHFPGLRRSAKAPDNLNIYTGATKTNPLIPYLKEQKLLGDEFVQFSLPVKAMQQAKGQFKINDNHNVSTLKKGKLHDAESPKKLTDLAGDISVEGSGGGYLSNEISYRSVRLRNLYHPILPVGHIHTPRIKAFEPKTTKAIIQQIKAMLTQATAKI